MAEAERKRVTTEVVEWLDAHRGSGREWLITEILGTDMSSKIIGHMIEGEDVLDKCVEMTAIDILTAVACTQMDDTGNVRRFRETVLGAIKKTGNRLGCIEWIDRRMRLSGRYRNGLMTFPYKNMKWILTDGVGSDPLYEWRLIHIFGHRKDTIIEDLGLKAITNKGVDVDYRRKLFLKKIADKRIRPGFFKRLVVPHLYANDVNHFLAHVKELVDNRDMTFANRVVAAKAWEEVGDMMIEFNVLADRSILGYQFGPKFYHHGLPGSPPMRPDTLVVDSATYAFGYDEAMRSCDGFIERVKNNICATATFVVRFFAEKEETAVELIHHAMKEGHVYIAERLKRTHYELYGYDDIMPLFEFLWKHEDIRHYIGRANSYEKSQFITFLILL